MKWFKHDCSARSDMRIRMLVDRHGITAVAVYWMLMEEAASHSCDFALRIAKTRTEQCKQSVVPSFLAQAVAGSMWISKRQLLNIVESCVEFGLFDRERWWKERVVSPSNGRTLVDEYAQKSRLRRELAERAIECPDNGATSSGSDREKAFRNLQ